jgi:hypothetical protein
LARKIAIEGETVHIKKSIAKLLVRRLLAVWVVQNAIIRRVPVTELSPGALARMPRCALPPKPYIPDDLPPYELPGLKFQLPKGIPTQVRFLVLAAREIARAA